MPTRITGLSFGSEDDSVLRAEVEKGGVDGWRKTGSWEVAQEAKRHENQQPGTAARLLVTNHDHQTSSPFICLK